MGSVVVDRCNPGMVMGRSERGSGCSENRAVPPAPDDFRVGEMREDLRDGPFSRRRALAQRRRRSSLDQPPELLGGPHLDLERVLAVEVTQNALHVLLGSFLHGSRPSELFVTTTKPPNSDRATPVTHTSLEHRLSRAPRRTAMPRRETLPPIMPTYP